MPQDFTQELLQLVVKTSTELPTDVRQALQHALKTAENSAETSALDTMLKNADLAVERCLPVCQDTGTLLFYVKAPVGFDAPPLKRTPVMPWRRPQSWAFSARTA